MRDDSRPEHLEELGVSPELGAEVHALEVVGDDLAFLGHFPLHHLAGDVRLKEVGRPGQGGAGGGVKLRRRKLRRSKLKMKKTRRRKLRKRKLRRRKLRWRKLKWII